MIAMLKPYDYQQRLIDEARKKLARAQKGVMLVSPAGSGKSIIIAEIARLTTKKGNRVLFMVHRKELINQMRQSFKQQDVNMKLCTLMTVRRVANRLGKLPKPQLIITDETHHSRAKSYRKVYDYYKDIPRLGFTATSWRMSHKGFTDIYDQIAMGPSVKWLIDHHHLAPFHYYAPKLSDLKEDELKANSTGDFTKNSIDDALGKTIFGDVYQKWLKFAKGQKTIIYCHSIEYSKRTAQQFQQHGINAVHVDSKTPSDQRDQIMADFKAGKIKVLCNVDLISEGFNVPDCSCSLLLRPTKSLVLFIQQSMRCMRYVPGKTATILDMVGNATRLKALPDDDFDWDSYFHGNYKKRDIAPLQCQYCFAQFNRREAKQYYVIGHKDGDEFKIERQIVGELDPSTKRLLEEQDKLGKVVECPECHKPAEISQLKPSKQKDKSNQNTSYTDLSTANGRLHWLASLSTKHVGDIAKVYDIFNARKQLGIPNSSGKQVHNPLFSTFSVIMYNNSTHTVSEKKLHRLADHLGKQYFYIHSQYAWANSHWKFEDHDKLNLTEQLNNDFY